MKTDQWVDNKYKIKMKNRHQKNISDIKYRRKEKQALAFVEDAYIQESIKTVK